MELATDSDKAADFLTGIIPRQAIDHLGPNPKQELLKRTEAVIANSSVKVSN